MRKYDRMKNMADCQIDIMNPDEIIGSNALHSALEEMELGYRIFWVIGQIDNKQLDIARAIYQLNLEDDDEGIPVEDRMPIRIMIYSSGGLAHVGKAIVDAIDISDTPVYTYNMGMAMSAAFYMLISGHKRFAMRSSGAMWHEPSSGFEGALFELQRFISHMEDLGAELKEHVLEKTDISEDLLAEKREEDWHMNAADQLKYGVVDKIVSSMDEMFSIPHAAEQAGDA